MRLNRPAARQGTNGSPGFYRKRDHGIPSVRFTALNRKTNRRLARSGIQNPDTHVVVPFRQILRHEQRAVEQRVTWEPFANVHGYGNRRRRLRRLQLHGYGEFFVDGGNSLVQPPHVNGRSEERRVGKEGRWGEWR